MSSEMCIVRREVQGTPADLLAILTDGWRYAGWVVGASRVRGVDADWPAVGTKIHHSVGSWPLLIDDSTSVQDFDPAGTLTMHARGWPVGAAVVRILWQDLGAGRLLVTIEEDATEGPGHFIPRPLRHSLLRPRNVETLRRLALMVEGRSDGPPPPVTPG